MDKRRIILVEDERIIAEDIKNTLINFGYEVIKIFAKGEDVLKQIAILQPDLILMDVMLAGETNGIETAAMINDIYDVPIIYLTAYANQTTLNQAKITEPYGYIIKPFEDRELHATIEMAFYRFYLESRIKSDERKYRTLFNSILDPVFIISKSDGMFIDCNDVVQEVYGYSKEELLTLSPADLHIDGEENFLINYNIKAAPTVFHHRTKTGKLRYVTAQTTEITYESTSVWLSIIHDITASKIAEKKLQNTQRRLSTVFHNAPNIVLYEVGSGRRFISENVENLIGVSADTLVNNPVIYPKMIHPNERHLVAEKIRAWRASSNQETLTLWYRLITANGSIIWIEDRMIKIHPVESKMYITGVMIDNSELKEAGTALKKSQSRYKAIVEDQTEFIFRFLNDGNITFVNKAFCRFAGESEKDLIGSTWIDKISEENVSGIKEKLALLTNNSPVINHEFSFTTKSGRKLFTEWNYRALFNENNEFIEYQAVGKDITAKKNTEAEKEKIREQLYQSQKMEVVGKLAGGIAHDFNNILTAIIGYADMAMKKLETENRAFNDIEVIKDCGLKAAKLTQQLLSFSRKQIVEKKTIDMNEIINELEKMMDRLIGNDIELITETSPMPCLVVADSGQIEQILINLIVNARDAMLEGGKIKTGCRIVQELPAEIKDSADNSAKEFIEIYVADTGTGMSEEIQNKIFEPFFTTKKVGKGTGLGLATVFGIVQQNEGLLNVKSALGKGSTFSIFFPSNAQGIIETQTVDIEEELPHGTETILLVEDEESIREFVSSILDEFGYKVIEAANGIRAIEAAKNNPEKIDLLLTDIRMPLMSGPELANKVKNLYPSTKILFVSGHSDNELIRQDIADSKVSFLQKPFSYEGLVNKVRTVLDS